MIIRFWGGIVLRAVLLAYLFLVGHGVVRSGETDAYASLVLIATILVGAFVGLQTLTALAGYATLRTTMKGKK